MLKKIWENSTCNFMQAVKDAKHLDWLDLGKNTGLAFAAVAVGTVTMTCGATVSMLRDVIFAKKVQGTDPNKDPSTGPKI